MSNQSSQFEIRITTPAELSGAKQVEQQLEREIGKAKALGQEYDALQQKLANVRQVTAKYEADSSAAAAASMERKARMRRIAADYLKDSEDAVPGFTQKLPAATKHLNEAEMSVRALHKALHPLVSQMLPQFGHLVSEVMVDGLDKSALKLGMQTIAIAAGAKAIEHYLDVNKEWMAQMEAMPQWAEAGVNALKIHTEAMNAAALAAHQYNLELDAIKNKPLSLQEKIAQNRERREIHNGVTEAIEDRRKGADLARVDASDADSASKAEQKYQIEQKYVAEKRARADQEARTKIGEMEYELNTSTYEQKKLQDQVKAKQDAAAKPAEAARKNREEGEKAKKDEETAKAARDKIDEELRTKYSPQLLDQVKNSKGSFTGWAAASSGLASMAHYGINPLNPVLYSEYHSIYDKMNKSDEETATMGAEKIKAKQSEEHQPELDKAEASAKQELKNFEDGLSAITKRMKELADSIKNSEEKIKSESKQRAGEDRLGAIESSYKELADLESQWKSLSGKKQLTPEETEQARSLRELIPQVRSRIQGLESQPLPTGDLSPAEKPKQRPAVVGWADNGNGQKVPFLDYDEGAKQAAKWAAQAREKIQKNAEKMAELMGEKEDADPNRRKILDAKINALDHENQGLNQRIHAVSPDGGQPVAQQTAQIHASAQTVAGKFDAVAQTVVAGNALLIERMNSFDAQLKDVNSRLRNNRSVVS